MFYIVAVHEMWITQQLTTKINDFIITKHKNLLIHILHKYTIYNVVVNRIPI